MSNIKIKDIPINERPRERLIKYGVNSLSNEDLISIILKNGCRDYNVKELSSIILNRMGDITNLRNLSINNNDIKGLGTVKIVELLAAIELGKRVYYEKEKINIKLNNTTVIYNYFKDIFIGENQENFYAIYLNTKSMLISYKLLFRGTINMSCVHPREVFKHAVLESAYSIIIMHNHPSNDTTPSMQDEEVTYSLMELGKMMGIPVLDHIIFGKDNYYSFYEHMNNN
jgi:DNA repair protein RadC